MNRSRFLPWFLLLSCASSCQSNPAHPVPEGPLWLTYAGEKGAGEGRHIVLIAAEQEYRSEQSLPMLARILSQSHGFHCTVLFSLNQEGLVDPTLKTRAEEEEVLHWVPGLEHLRSADLVIFFNRFITLPEADLQRVVEYLDSGKPILALRTANHGFLGPFPYTVHGRNVRFGEDVLGGTFLNHHGNWHADSTRGILVEEMRDHPILTGIQEIWGPSDVYRTYPEGASLPAGCTALVYGQPLLGRTRQDGPNPEKEPLPIAWTKSWTGSSGKSSRVFHLTMGSGQDFLDEGVRRLTINASYWCLGLEDKIRAESSVAILGPYEPLDTGFNYAELGVVPKPPAAYR